MPEENRNCNKLGHIILSNVSLFARRMRWFDFQPKKFFRNFFSRREWKVKYDLVDDNDEDTLEYSYKNTFIYNPAKNGPGLTGDEVVTLVHPLILGMALSINVDRPELLPFIGNAINGIFGNPTDAFWTGRAMDILFGGIPLDCTSDAFEVAAACSEFSTGDYKSIQPLNETFYKFSLFGGVNSSLFFWATVRRIKFPYFSGEWDRFGTFYRATWFKESPRFGPSAEIQRWNWNGRLVRRRMQ